MAKKLKGIKYLTDNTTTGNYEAHTFYNLIADVFPDNYKRPIDKAYGIFVISKA